MSRVRTTLTIDDGLLRSVKVQAARAGMKDSEFIEEAVRAKLGMDVFDRIWAKADLGEAEAMGLALEAQRETRLR